MSTFVSFCRLRGIFKSSYRTLCQLTNTRQFKSNQSNVIRWIRKSKINPDDILHEHRDKLNAKFNDLPKSSRTPNNKGFSGATFKLIVATAIAMYMWQFVVDSKQTTHDQTMTWATFERMLRRGEVVSLTVGPSADRALIRFRNDTILDNRPIGVPYRYLSIQSVEKLEENIRAIEQDLHISPASSIEINYYRSSSLISLTIFALFCLLLYVMMKNVRFNVSISSGFDAMKNVTKAKFREVGVLTGKKSSIKFENVAGLKEAKVELMEFVSYLKSPKRYQELGAKIPKGALLLGPPGCGKTLLAKALSAEAGVPFLSMAGSEFVEVLGGLGAARVRDLFKEARKRAPCIIYIDELDAIGRKRSTASSTAGQSSGEEEHTLNQLLVEMDGLVTSLKTVIMLASTNRPDILDKALLRPGRFDRHIWIDLPNRIEREEIVDLHLKNIKLNMELNREDIARSLAAVTAGMSGADLANLCNEAALHAALRKNSEKGVLSADIEAALDKVTMSAAKKTSTLSEAERKLVAIHESGHALVGWMLDHTDTISKVSVIQRVGQGKSFGHTRLIPVDFKLLSQDAMLNRMAATLGGRVAEAVVSQTITTGASDDLKTATQAAYDQVQRYGMCDVIGPISFEHDGHEIKPFSRRLQATIDQEAQSLVAKAHQTAESIIRSNMDKLMKLSNLLLAQDSVSHAEIVEIWGDPRNEPVH